MGLLEGLMKGLENSWRRQTEERYARRDRRQLITDKLAQDEALYQQQQSRRPGEFAQKMAEHKTMRASDREVQVANNAEDFRAQMENQKTLDAAQREQKVQLINHYREKFGPQLEKLPKAEQEAFWMELETGVQLPTNMSPEMTALLSKPTPQNLEKAWAMAQQTSSDKDDKAVMSARQFLTQTQAADLNQLRASLRGSGGGRSGGGRAGSGGQFRTFRDPKSGKYFREDKATGAITPLDIGNGQPARTGPSDAELRAKKFKAETGMTPTQYRLKYEKQQKDEITGMPTALSPFEEQYLQEAKHIGAAGEYESQPDEPDYTSVIGSRGTLDFGLKGLSPQPAKVPQADRFRPGPKYEINPSMRISGTGSLIGESGGNKSSAFQRSVARQATEAAGRNARIDQGLEPGTLLRRRNNIMDYGMND
jgi:hypothetical protein